jgi:aspartyl protease family protein
LQAKDVPIVIENDDRAAFGDGVDGLLGMSFLSRFKVTIDTQVVKISNRQTK